MAEVGTVAVEAAADILDLELTAMWEYDEVEQELVPVAATDDVRATLGELPHFTPGESLAWDTFVDGDLDVYEDIPNTDGIHNPETVIQCEIIAPLGRHGLLMTGSTTAQSFSNRDIDLFSILAASVEAALGRAEREEELRRQNQRLGEFADVVAHDLRNPLTVAQGFLDVARETGDDAHFAEVEWAHRRMETLIDDLLTLAHSGRTIDSPEQIALETVAREAWVHLDTADASCTISPELPVIEGDESRLLQLFENLFRNAIQHGGDRVNISVEPLASGDGFFVADDGPGIDPENRLAVLEHGVTFSDDGTGLGLAIASEIVHAHGWSIRVTDSASGGARFEFSFEESSTRD
nr:GAF domain-containing sensor histidine kinase [Haloarchaeobius amylolyticus]